MVSRRGLSIQPDDWIGLSRTLVGVDWREIMLDGLYQGSVPKKAGIYLLVVNEGGLAKYRLPEGISPVIYIGRSDNLRSRFLNHTAKTTQNKLISTFRLTFGSLRFHFSTVPTQAGSHWLGDTEKILIRVFDPPANKVIPTISTINGTLKPPLPVG